jgi:hypothetical protein
MSRHGAAADLAAGLAGAAMHRHDDDAVAAERSRLLAEATVDRDTAAAVVEQLADLTGAALAAVVELGADLASQILVRSMWGVLPAGDLPPWTEGDRG